LSKNFFYSIALDNNFWFGEFLVRDEDLPLSNNNKLFFIDEEGIVINVFSEFSFRKLKNPLQDFTMKQVKIRVRLLRSKKRSNESLSLIYRSIIEIKGCIVQPFETF
jgi:hypothetical protein